MSSNWYQGLDFHEAFFFIPVDTMTYVLFQPMLKLFTLHDRGQFSRIIILPIFPTLCEHYRMGFLYEEA